MLVEDALRADVAVHLQVVAAVERNMKVAGYVEAGCMVLMEASYAWRTHGLFA